MSKMTSYEKTLNHLKANGVAYTEMSVTIEVSLGSTKSYNYVAPNVKEALDDPLRASHVRRAYSNFTGTTFWESVIGRGLHLTEEDIVVNFLMSGAFHSTTPYGGGGVRHHKVYTLQSLHAVLRYIEAHSPTAVNARQIQRAEREVEVLKERYDSAAAQLDETKARREERLTQATLAVMKAVGFMQAPTARLVVEQLDQDGLLMVDTLATIGRQEERRNALANELADAEKVLEELKGAVPA